MYARFASAYSDWTTLNIVRGGAWIRPELVSASESATTAGFEEGDRLLLTQSLPDANAGNEVEMIWGVLLTNLTPGGELILQIERGNLGKTQVAIFNYLGESPIEVKYFVWDQVTSGRNSHQIALPVELLTTPEP